MYIIAALAVCIETYVWPHTGWLHTCCTSDLIHSDCSRVTLMERAEGAVHLKNLSLQPAGNEEEGVCVCGVWSVCVCVCVWCVWCVWCVCHNTQ